MKRQVLLLLSAVVLAPACVLDIEVLDDVADEYGESDESSTDAESSSTDAEDDQSEESTSSSTDAESSSTDAEDDQSEESTSSSTDAESSSTDAEDDQSEESTSSSTDAESSSSDDADELPADDFPADCFGIEAEYEAIVTMTDCSQDSDCKIIGGHCGVGLGGCYYAVNESVDETELADLADIWSNGGCTQGVCDCPESPDFAICEAGTCMPGN